MVVDPWTGEIQERERPSVSRIAPSGGSLLEELMDALSDQSDALDEALADEERTELALLFAESVALVEHEGKVPATILAKYARSLCKEEAAAYTSARSTRIRAEKQVRKTEHLMMGEQSRLKYLGRADGGSR